MVVVVIDLIHGVDKVVVGDAPLYAMNISYYHWLIKKLVWQSPGRTGPGEKPKQR